jgi:hypothetical protein
MLTIAIDPSGNFEDGKGHTGVAYIEGSDWNTVKSKSINAKDFETRYDYWNAVKKVIQDIGIEHRSAQIVIESYVTRTNGFTIGKMPETAMLIGVLVYFCEMYKIPYYLQNASQAKTRFKDNLLPDYIPGLELKEHGRYYLKGKLTNDHERDALKHLLYFKRYKEYKI